MCADRVGVLGGTFDPVHLGHLASARDVANAFALDRVLLVLAAQPPHKPDGAAASARDRWRMLQLATAESARSHADEATIEPCDVELERKGPSYTVDTLHDLAQRLPDAHLFLIIGIDAYAEIDTWSRPGRILELANVIVTTRPGMEFTQGAVIPPVAARESARYDSSIGGYVHTSGHTLSGHGIDGIEVSATDIRRRVREGLPIAHLTGDDVAAFIHEHGLYRSGPTGTGKEASA